MARLFTISANRSFVSGMGTILLAVLAGCEESKPQSKSTSASQAPPAPSQEIAAPKPTASASGMKPPGKEILFQPMLVWEGSEPTYQGTGFFVKAPNGKIAAVTSAHFIERDGPP